MVQISDAAGYLIGGIFILIGSLVLAMGIRSFTINLNNVYIDTIILLGLLAITGGIVLIFAGRHSTSLTTSKSES